MATEENVPTTGVQNQKKAESTFSFQLVLYAIVVVIVLMLCFNMFFQKRSDVSPSVNTKTFSIENGAQGEAGPGSSR